MYHIYIDGHRITDEPVTLELINKIYGGMKKLEQKGFRALKVN